MSAPLPRIRLTYDDYPGEFIEVEALGSNVRTIKCVVPMTHVTFFLNRPDNGTLYQGVLGGRSCTYDPGTVAKKAKAA